MTMALETMPYNLVKQVNMTWCQVVSKTITCGFTFKIKLLSHLKYI